MPMSLRSSVSVSVPPASRLSTTGRRRSPWRGLLLAATASFGLCAAAVGQPLELPLGVTAANERFISGRTSVATRADGGFAAVWDVADPANEVRLQWLDAEGRPTLEDGGRLVSGATDLVSRPLVVAGVDGGVFVAYTREPAFLEQEIVVQAFDDVGAPRWPDGGVSVTTLETFLIDDWLVSDGEGGAVSCWSVLDDGGIWCQRLGPDGYPLWGAQGVQVGSAGRAAEQPRMVLDGAGGFLVLWFDQGLVDDPAPRPLEIRAQRLDAAGTLLWPQDLLIESLDRQAPIFLLPSSLKVSPDGAGGAVLAFEDRDAADTRDIVRAQRLATDGSKPWGDSVVLSDSTDSWYANASVRAPDGGQVVALQQFDGLETSRLRLVRVAIDGSLPWGVGGVALSAPESDGTNDSLAGAFILGELRVAWTQQTGPESTDTDIVTARFGLDGSRRGPFSEPVVTAPDFQLCAGLVAAPTTGRSVVVWTDRRSGVFNDLDTYGALFETEGVLFIDGFESGDLSAWSVSGSP